MLTIDQFSKVYKGGKRAVDGLILEVSAGDIYGFIGHNGAGKTTTLRAIAGILDFEEGDIRIDGRSIREDPVSCKQVMAYIPDNPDLYEHLTGLQYLGFICDLYSVPRAARQERIAALAGQLELTGALGGLIGSYSHGMKQKLAVISALVHQPKLLLLDEPFVGLDPKASFTLKQLMRQLCQQGSAIFFSTHVLDVAEKLCNKIAIIQEGRLVASGPIEQVKGQESLEKVFMELMDHETVVDPA